MKQVVLGSGSPRRREILEMLGISCTILRPDVDETVKPGELADGYLERIARAKFEAVRNLVESDHPLLVADTVVVDRGDIFGKPVDADDALKMITRLCGNAHETKTRFLIGKSGQILHEETVTTALVFRSASAQERAAYVASGEWVDRAGGYAVQGRASGFVARIDGSYTNVVGLPACEVLVALMKLGFA